MTTQHPGQTERERLLAELSEVQNQLTDADKRFHMATQPEQIERCVHEINALKARHADIVKALRAMRCGMEKEPITWDAVWELSQQIRALFISLIPEERRSGTEGTYSLIKAVEAVSDELGILIRNYIGLANDEDCTAGEKYESYSKIYNALLKEQRQTQRIR